MSDEFTDEEIASLFHGPIFPEPEQLDIENISDHMLAVYSASLQQRMFGELCCGLRNRQQIDPSIDYARIASRLHSTEDFVVKVFEGKIVLTLGEYAMFFLAIQMSPEIVAVPVEQLRPDLLKLTGQR